MSPLFSRKPKQISCPFCSEQVQDTRTAKLDHWETHVFPVTDNNGERAFTFECPKCGPSDRAWGAGRTEESARLKAASAVGVHLMERHGVSL